MTDTGPSDFCNDGSAPLRVPRFGNMPCYVKLPSLDRYSTPFDYARHPQVTVRELSVLRAINDITEEQGWAEAVLHKDAETLSAWRTAARQRSELINDQAWTWILRELTDKAHAFLESKSQIVLVFNTGAIGLGRSIVYRPADEKLEPSRTQIGPAGFSVIKTDALVQQSLTTELQKAMSSFFTCNTNHGHVYQVDPNMYPLTYRQTPVLEHAGQTVSLHGKLSKGPGLGTPSRARFFQEGRDKTRMASSDFSKEFQWLPSEVEFRNKSSVAITSYINNLDPNRFPKIYHAIEKILALAIEPWNQVIVEASRGRTPLRILTFGVEYSPPRLYRTLSWVEDPYELADEETRKTAQEYIENYGALPGSPHSGDEEHAERTNALDDITLRNKAVIRSRWKSDWEAGACSGCGYVNELYERWCERRKCPNRHPEMGGALSYDAWKAGDTGACVVPSMCLDPLDTIDPRYIFQIPLPVDLWEKFRHKGLQVVVKMSSIELTPEHPAYEAAAWAVEGMADEHIVAVARHFYSVENVDAPAISFLHTGRWDSDEYDFDEADFDDLADVLGIGWDEVHARQFCNYRTDTGQYVGTISVHTGRFLAYPNHLMTRVEKCELKDKAKPGYIRSLTLSLVDPHYRICSTRNVLPQQPSIWFRRALQAILPVELQDMVQSYTVDRLTSREEAKPRRPAFVRESQKWHGCSCMV